MAFKKSPQDNCLEGLVELGLLVVLDRAHPSRITVRPRLGARVVLTELGRRRLDDGLEEPIEKRVVLLRVHCSHLLSVLA